MPVSVPKYRLSLGGAGGLMAGLLLGGSSCGDPVQDELIEDLGGEKAGVPPGPSHRPGQPCVTCHNEEFGNAPPFTVGGTVYVDAMTSTPIGNVEVKVIDSQARSFTTTTNCAGNFFVRPNEFTPTFPIWLEMRAGMVLRTMDTASFREGSCAACHSDPKSPSSAGHVYLIDDPINEMPPPNQCP